MFKNKSAKVNWVCGLMVAVLFSTPAMAVVVNWADWESPTSGSLVADGEFVGVSASATNGGFIGLFGPTFWSESSPAPYTGGIVENAPEYEVNRLLAGGEVTVTFSRTVSDVYIALLSWNVAGVTEFGTPLQVISEGRGFYGDGSVALTGSGTGFIPSGELHGVLLLEGEHNSFTFTHGSENWHGFTVGVAGLPQRDPNPAPVPGVLWLLGLGLIGMAGFAVRKA